MPALFRLLLSWFFVLLFLQAAPLRAELPPSALEKGRFLLATEQMGDPRFAESVVLILAHNDRLTRGIVLNRPTRWPLSHAFPKLKEQLQPFDRLFWGGPVAPYQPSALIRTLAPPEEHLKLFADIYQVSVRDALQRLMEGSVATTSMRFYLGFVNWAPGQLEQEMGRGSWTLIEGIPGAVFTAEPETLWKGLAAPDVLEVRIPLRPGFSAG